ncbi:MAG TPA: single-stranded DNA-binding protein [Thermoanaerobacterales bacterium]|nr:single-stranded DNA-binding protein [Thermoanaerobacterales bacterium]
MNKVILIGRLTREPELRYTPANSVPVANFTLAVDRPFLNQKGEREADFIRVVAWRKLAELCSNNLIKGQMAAVFGRLQVRSYEAQDGQRRTISEVVADEVKFLERPRGSSGTSSFDDINSDIKFDPGMEDIEGMGGIEGDEVPF